MSAKPEILESFYSEFIQQPRSKLKLPIEELIKLKIIEDANKTDKALQVQSNADKMLECLRSDSLQIIPRLENINEVSRELAIEGQWEKAESLILNMKNDCKSNYIMK